MAIYRCKFLSLDGKIETVEGFECNTDGAARVLAAERLIAGNFSTVQLWQRSRCVFPGAAEGVRKGAWPVLVAEEKAGKARSVWA